MAATSTAVALQLEQFRERLQQQIEAAETQLLKLRSELKRTEEELSIVNASRTQNDSDCVKQAASQLPKQPILSLEEYRRYGRQMILPRIGQLFLRSSRVLIVGAGGLGSPASLYLAASGVGTLGLLDNDTVDVCNLHRQVIHTTPNASAAKHKVDSAIESLSALNPNVKYIAYKALLTAENAEEIFRGYDVVLDCSDNPATRYLVSDTAVLLGQPLISASALGTEGQLMVLNYPPAAPGNDEGGPCYRCIFPKPPPANTVMKCAEGGVLGPVVGVMGVMQALEAMKVIIAMGKRKKGKAVEPFVPTLHLFSGYANPTFRSVKLRRRRADCAVCSEKASLTLRSIRNGDMDYIMFCGSKMGVRLLGEEERVDPVELKERLQCRDEADRPILIDTRDETQFGICSLGKGVVNIPISKIMSLPSSATVEELGLVLPGDLIDNTNTRSTIVMCRMGNDSQRAVKKLKELGLDNGGKRYIGDLNGGLWRWRSDVDAEFPEY
ncbi:Urmylation protein [Ascosphaera aggregata]|nr:Urmylation protein [Ascosphaera aggregata]